MEHEAERLARIETKLDILTTSFMNADADKETRMRALERRDAYVLGIAGLLAFVAPIVAKKVFNL